MGRHLPAARIVLGLVATGADALARALRFNVLDCRHGRGVLCGAWGAPIWIQPRPTSGPQAPAVVE